jgi:hypothetical protein
MVASHQTEDLPGSPFFQQTLRPRCLKSAHHGLHVFADLIFVETIPTLYVLWFCGFTNKHVHCNGDIYIYTYYIQYIYICIYVCMYMEYIYIMNVYI